MRFLLVLLPSLLAAQTYDIVLQRGRRLTRFEVAARSFWQAKLRDTMPSTRLHAAGGK